MKLQGEFLVKLRKLEDDLLNKLSSVQGNILDDEDAIKTLETLKSEAEKVNKDMEESGQVLAEVETTTSQYSEVARVSAMVYFTLQNMTGVYTFYQFSLQFYMNIIMKLIKENEKLKAVDKQQHEKRIETIISELFKSIYHKTYYTFLNKDKLSFGLKLAQIKLGAQFQSDFNNLLKPCSLIKTSLDAGMLDGLLKEAQLK